MTTRCDITVEDGEHKYRIYRHTDGYPKGVISDLKVMLDNYDRKPDTDPEYFLANFIFYAKLGSFLRSDIPKWVKNWEYSYGVCEPNCEHSDLEYRYIIKGDKIRIERFDYVSKRFAEVFNGPIKKAIEKYAVDGGCHISPSDFWR